MKSHSNTRWWSKWGGVLKQMCDYFGDVLPFLEKKTTVVFDRLRFEKKEVREKRRNNRTASEEVLYFPKDFLCQEDIVVIQTNNGKVYSPPPLWDEEFTFENNTRI